MQSLIIATLLAAAPLPALAQAAQPAAPAAVTDSQDEAEIRALIARMETAWNRGDFEGYMAGFANPGVVFVSRGRIQDGWQGTLDHYVRDYGGAPQRRGVLHFYDISVEMLGPDAAMLVSHYRLQRPENPQEGINTRLMRKIDGRWVIALNHVSSYDPTAPSN
jgi:uncharacterized protein (TIGR02246 family)